MLFDLDPVLGYRVAVYTALVNYDPARSASATGTPLPERLRRPRRAPANVRDRVTQQFGGGAQDTPAPQPAPTPAPAPTPTPTPSPTPAPKSTPAPKQQPKTPSAPEGDPFRLEG